MIRLFPFLFQVLAAQPHEDCLSWFEKAKIKQDRNCEINCSVLDTNMKTYMCPNQCDMLCKFDFKEKQPALNFYGLTDDEVRICKSDPIFCAKAYKDSLQAENLCLEIYLRSANNDESDACRHFIWAGFLAKNYGIEKARMLLDAHENNPREPIDQKSMDLANNRAGLFTAEKLVKESKFSDKAIREEFLKQLEKGSIIVLRPGSKLIPMGKP